MPMLPKRSWAGEGPPGGRAGQDGFEPLQLDVEGGEVGIAQQPRSSWRSSQARAPVLLTLSALFLGGLVALAPRLAAPASSSGGGLAAVTLLEESNETEETRAAPTTIELYQLLGQGRCINQTGANASNLTEQPDAKVLHDGSSPDCEKACSKAANCTGYSTKGGKCHTLTNKDFLPSAADGTEGATCFWRRKFASNTTDLYPAGQKVEIPKILWSYWKFMPSAPATLAEFVHLCTSSWHSRNPGWEVRILNDTTIKDWLSADDLPDDFDSMDVQVAHRSDIIRLALLSKHGGVWLDATSLTTHSMDELFGSHEQRTFFNLPYPSVVPGLVDRRVDWTYWAENWVMAAPPKDPLIERVSSCVLKFFAMPAETRQSYADTGLFTKTQLQMLNFVGITEYVSTTACFLKVIDDDAAIASWYSGPSVRHLSSVAGVGTWWWSQPALAHKVLLETTNKTMTDTLLNDVPIFKFDHNMRQGFILPLTPKQLWCKKNTFHAVISEIGVENKDLCDKDEEHHDEDKEQRDEAS